MLDNLWSWVSDAEDTMATTEATPIGNDLESVEEQLSGHEVSTCGYIIIVPGRNAQSLVKTSMTMYKNLI